MVEYDLAAPQGQDQYVSMVPGPHSARTSRSMVPIKQPAVRSNTQPMMMSRFPMAGGEPNGAMNTQAVDLAWEMIRQERKLHKNWREILDAFERVMPRFGSIDPRLIERGKPMIVSLSTITSAHEALVRSVAGVASASQLLDPNVWCQSINGIALLGSAQIHMNYKEFADGFAFVQMQYAQLLQACSASSAPAKLASAVSVGTPDTAEVFLAKLVKPLLALARLSDLVDWLMRVRPCDQVAVAAGVINAIRHDPNVAALILRIRAGRVESINAQLHVLSAGRVVMASGMTGTTIIWSGRLSHGLRGARHSFLLVPGLLVWLACGNAGKLVGFQLLSSDVRIDIVPSNPKSLTILGKDGTQLAKLTSKSASTTRIWAALLRQASSPIVYPELASSVGLPFNVQHKVHVTKDLVWSAGGDPENLFVLVRKIGEGAFGAVYEVIHKMLGVKMAAKVVAAGGAQSDAIRKEIDILTVCRHPNIVTYYGTTMDTKKRLWVLMDICEGGSVHQLGKALHLQWNELQVAYICHGTLLALAYLHGLRIVHRDVKGRNILISRQGTVCLTDFGVSKRLLPSAQNSMLTGPVGTPYWMSPEVAAGRGSRVSWSADIWSLAITAIELADGHPPYFSLKPAQAMKLIAENDPPTLENPSRWSFEFRDFLNCCLQKDPFDRPSAESLLRHPFVIAGAQVDPRIHIAPLVEHYLSSTAATPAK
ncbi:hypothetical protein PBRA_009117 [Plasmodiophora brassicae]|nr:hypothetical protein PBRA_009117 [Plasmodiophora brassicae]